jgi:hypothetical protein
MSLTLQELRAQTAECTDRARQLHARAGDKWAQRPTANRWSAAECVEHLNLTAEAFLPRLKRAVEQARTLPPASGPYQIDWAARLLNWLLEPPARMKMPTGPAFVPSLAENAEVVLPRFEKLQTEVNALIVASEGLAVDKVKITSLFAENFKYSAYGAFCVIPTHERRHLWQAERALDGK